MSEQHDGPEKIGYGRPPKSHRFKPGISGNPRGRPKRATTKAAIIHKVRSERIAIVVNGKRLWVDPFEAAVRTVLMTCLKNGRVGDLVKLAKFFEEEAFDWRAEMQADWERSADDVVAKILQMFDRTVPDDPE